MREVLTYFMWGFQQHFRAGVEYATEGVLRDIGLPVKVRVLLAGFAATDAARWPICVEPEFRFFQPSHLESVPARALELYDAHPERDMLHSDRRLHDLRHRMLRDHCRAAAIVEALEEHDPDATRYFVGHSTQVGDYEVHTAIGIAKADLAGVPRLNTTERDRFVITPSLPDGCLTTILGLSAQGLHRPDAGSGVVVLAASSAEITRRGAEKVMTSVEQLAGNIGGGALYQALGRLSTLRYEGETGAGALIIAAEGDPDVDVQVRLRTPIRISEARTLRKLLEMTDKDRLSLLTDGSDVFGLGHVRDSYDPDAERIFVADVLGEGHWELRHAGTRMLKLEFGQPRLPNERIDQRSFADTVARIFEADTDVASDDLWQLALGAADQAHGTMLVISSNAADEAERLRAQAIGIEPTRFSASLLRDRLYVRHHSPETCEQIRARVEISASRYALRIQKPSEWRNRWPRRLCSFAITVAPKSRRERARCSDSISPTRAGERSRRICAIPARTRPQVALSRAADVDQRLRLLRARRLIQVEGGHSVARRTIIVSDLTGKEINDRDAAQVVIKYADARRGQVVLDVNASEVEELAAKGTKQARRGRKPKPPESPI